MYISSEWRRWKLLREDVSKEMCRYNERSWYDGYLCTMYSSIVKSRRSLGEKPGFTLTAIAIDIERYLNIFIHTRNTNNVQCHSWRSYHILFPLFVVAKWSLKPDVDVEAWSWPGGGMEVWPYFCPLPAQLQCCSSGTILLITASIIAMQHCEDTQRHSLARKLDRE